MRKEYPLTDDDLAAIGRRMARGEECIVPIRIDIELLDGSILENRLIWGHPNAYEIVKVAHARGCLFYGRAKED